MAMYLFALLIYQGLAMKSSDFMKLIKKYEAATIYSTSHQNNFKMQTNKIQKKTVASARCMHFTIICTL